MIKKLAELTFDDVFIEISTGRIFVIKNFEAGMVEVKEAYSKRFWAWPVNSKVRLVNKQSV